MNDTTFLNLNLEVDRCVMESVRLCAPAKSVSDLAKCENGRRELIDLKCVPKDCSCNADIIDATNETELQNCLDFRNQYIVNPCFGELLKIFQKIFDIFVFWDFVTFLEVKYRYEK